MKIIYLLLCLFTISPLQSYAQSYNDFGISMHGQPKYNSSSKYLEYVNPKAPKGGNIKISMTGTFDSLNPYAIKGKPAQGLNLIYGRLMVRVWDEPFTLYPLIAEKITYPEDRSSISFTINKRAKFNDGTPITANDVIFSFETLRDKGRPNMRRIYSLATEYKKIDDYNVMFKFGKNYDRETIMIFAMMPVLSQKYWQEHEFDRATLEIPITNGPYKISKINPGKQIIYERDPNYWAADIFPNIGQYNFNKIIYDYYRDENIEFEAFKAGEFDLRREFNPTFWASSYDFPLIKTGIIKKEELPHSRPERVKALIFNTRRAPFNDINVRKALNLAFDFDWINKNILYNQEKRITSYYPNSELAAQGKPSEEELKILNKWKDKIPAEVFETAWQAPTSKTREEVKANLRKATKILKEAGWQIIDGVLVNKNTKEPFHFEILLNSSADQKIALSFKNSLKRLGITPTIRMSDSADFTGRLTKYDFDMVIHHWQSSLSPGTEQYLYWSCEAAKQPARWNYAGICNSAIDEISKKIANTKDRKELITYTKALDRILTYGYYMIPLGYIGKDFVAYKNNIKRPEKTPIYGMVIESWWTE